MVDRPPLAPVSPLWKLLLAVLTLAARAVTDPCILAGREIGDALYTPS